MRGLLLLAPGTVYVCTFDLYITDANMHILNICLSLYAHNTYATCAHIKHIKTQVEVANIVYVAGTASHTIN